MAYRSEDHRRTTETVEDERDAAYMKRKPTPEVGEVFLLIYIDEHNEFIRSGWFRRRGRGGCLQRQEWVSQRCAVGGLAARGAWKRRAAVASRKLFQNRLMQIMEINQRSVG